ncbi:MAG: hypothetical protein ACKV19_10720 [Verrucomicrobiales bacterium]
MPSPKFIPLRHVVRGIILLLALAAPAATRAARLTSSDGKTREFPVIVRATPDGLMVRETPTGKDILIPWTRLDAVKSAEGNSWFEDARSKAAAGESVILNIGVAEPESGAADWRSVTHTVTGGKGKNSTKLSLSAYVHREVAVPRLALVWVGEPSPLAKRADAADMARRMQGALVVAEFEGGYGQADAGSGQALVAGVTDLLRLARSGKTSASDKAGKAAASGSGLKEGLVDADGGAEADEANMAKDSEGAEVASAAGAALILMGRGEAAAFVWNLLCTRPRDVVAAVVIGGELRTESTAGAFATPCLFLESPDSAVAAVAAPTAVDLTRPRDLWRHYSSDGCRWCFAAPAGDPLALAVAFARDAAAASPYFEAFENLESWQNNKLRHRIPMPVLTAKNFKEDAFRLAAPDGTSVFRVSAKTGAARNDLVWVPSSAFAALLSVR